MKKVFTLILLVFSFLGYAQGDLTEGIITTSQKMSSDNEQMNAQISMMGDIITTTYFKNDKSRTEISNPMTGDLIVITDGKTKEMITFMDNPMAGKKYMKGSLDIPEDDMDNVTIKKGDEIKTILGYSCQQYFVTVNMEEQTMEMQVFAADAISAYSQQTTAYKSKLKGFPLYTTMNMSQMGATITVVSEVTEIKKETLSDDKFSMAILEGYDEMKQN
ncbi:MAG: hypothetical protein DA407_07220 [Bacteroidetes bacterium]|nr:MAG: hypothetical protein DA407_07220 [Bacteroidota bacterium]